MKLKFIPLLSILFLFLAACGNNSAKTPDGSETALPSENEPTSFVFTANEGGSITKIDASANKVLDTIKVDGAVHNVQLSPDGKVLAATVVPEMVGMEDEHDESDEEHQDMVMNGKVNFYDSAMDQLIQSVEVGAHPAHVVYTHDGKYALL